MGRKGLNQEMLIEEGIALISDKGAENFSIRELAARLGVKPASLYNHMESAANLTETIGRQALRRLEEELAGTQNAGTPQKCLLEKALAYRRFAIGQPQLYKMILKIPREGSAELQEQGRSLYSTIYPLLDLLSVPKDEHVHFCRALRSAMHGFIALEEAGFFSPEVDCEASYAYMINIVIGGLCQ